MKKFLFITVFSFLCCALYAQGTQKKATTRTYTKSEDSLRLIKQAKDLAKQDSADEIGLYKEAKEANFIFEGTLIESK